MENIRREVSQLLGMVIPPEGWDRTFRELDTKGRISNRTLLDIIVVLCKKVEQLEK
jgi:hypothetical protein